MIVSLKLSELGKIHDLAQCNYHWLWEGKQAVNITKNIMGSVKRSQICERFVYDARRSVYLFRQCGKGNK